MPLWQRVPIMKILIADDSAVVRARLTSLLTDLHGIEVVGQAEDVMEARNLVEKLRPDVAILDLRMPKGSGADVLYDIKKLHPTPKVIMLTNYPHPETRKSVSTEGRIIFLTSQPSFKEWCRY